MKITATKFKNQYSKLVGKMQKQHSPIIITKYGKPVAKLVPYNQDNTNENSRRTNFGRLKDTLTINEDIIKPTEETWNADL